MSKILDKSIHELDTIIQYVESNIIPTKAKQTNSSKQTAVKSAQKSSDPDIALFQNANIQVVRVHNVQKHPSAGKSMHIICCDNSK